MDCEAGYCIKIKQLFFQKIWHSAQFQTDYIIGSFIKEVGYGRKRIPSNSFREGKGKFCTDIP